MAVDTLWGGCLRGGCCTLSGLAIWIRDVGFRDFGGAEGAGAGCRDWVEEEEKEFPLV